MPQKFNKLVPNVGGLSTTIRWDLARSAAKIELLGEVLKGAGNRPVLVLCHNNPDPDTIAGAFAFSFLLQKKFGLKSMLGYGGMVTRAENKAMIQRLRINMQRYFKLDESKFYGIALIDAQPGTGNNLLEGKDHPPLIVIDHHPLRIGSLKAGFHDIRPKFGATSTIVTEYLVAAGIEPSRSVANALLYGIKADTNSLLRGAGKVDFTAFNYLSPLTNPRVISQIEKPVLVPEYFKDYQQGLSRTIIYRDVAVCDIGRIHSESIIPELADLLLRLDGVSWAICLGRQSETLNLSLRSTSRLFRAGTVLRKLIGKRGSAGGHKDMAGGQICLTDMEDVAVQEFCKSLIKRFLRLIKRDNVTGRYLTHNGDEQIN